MTKCKLLTPLTEEQIARLWYDADYGLGHTRAPGYATSFARAIERAHSIGCVPQTILKPGANRPTDAEHGDTQAADSQTKTR